MLTFTSAQPVHDLFRFYQERAHETGWTQVLPANPYGGWRKVTAGKRSGASLGPNFSLNQGHVTESGYSLEVGG